MTLLLLITPGHTQQIQISNIDTDHGYLLFSSKPIQLPSAVEHHCLRINLTEINTITESFGNKILNTLAPTRNTFLYNKLLKELNGITIHQENRQKRGLLNIVGTAYKYLFGTLDENDRVEIQNNLETVAQNSVKVHELNDVIQLANSGLEKLKQYEDNRNSIDTLTYELMQFIEFIEDIEMGMQLSRLGLFNPKLLNYDKLENVNSQNILLIKTSTWINHKDNHLLIISHIPIAHEEKNTVKITPYPDHNGYQLDYTDTKSYYENKNKIYNEEHEEVHNDCITSIIKSKNPICNFTPINTKEMIKYIEPNIILTWNLTETIITQNCQKSNSNIKISGNKIIRITQCKLEIGNIILSKNYLKPEIDLTPLYPPLEITKIKNIQHNEIVKLISQNNFTFYMIIIIIIFILIILYLYSKYVTKNPITMLYLKIRKQKNENHTSTPENSTVNIETTQNPLPTLYPAVSA